MTELEQSSGEDVVELKRLAQEKADEIVSEVLEIENSINVIAQVGEIAQYLEENGFELGE